MPRPLVYRRHQVLSMDGVQKDIWAVIFNSLLNLKTLDPHSDLDHLSESPEQTFKVLDLGLIGLQTESNEPSPDGLEEVADELLVHDLVEDGVFEQFVPGSVVEGSPERPVRLLLNDQFPEVA